MYHLQAQIVVIMQGAQYVVANRLSEASGPLARYTVSIPHLIHIFSAEEIFRSEVVRQGVQALGCVHRGGRTRCPNVGMCSPRGSGRASQRWDTSAEGVDSIFDALVISLSVY